MNGKQQKPKHSFNSLLVFGGVFSAICLTPIRANAILPAKGTATGECAWANVVQLQNSDGSDNCTGTLIAPHAILTAAHCGNMAFARFGETDLASGGEEIEVDLNGCTVHPSYMGGPNGNPGVDIQICTVDSADLALIEDVPIVPIMVPTGPARDWLRSKVYMTPYNDTDGPEVWVVGAGCNFAPCDNGDTDETNDQTYKGDKYELTTPARLFQQRGPDDLQFSETSITVLCSEIMNGSTTADGDSGGPGFVKMRDGTWRLIGALHDDTHEIQHEAAPSHLEWIEFVTGEYHTTTPCHDYVNGEWTWTGPCTTVFPTNPDVTGTRSWATQCAGVSTGGGLYPGANTVPDSPLDIQPDSGEDNLWVPLAILDDAYDDALTMAINGDFGTPPNQQQVADYFIAQAADEYHFPFIANVYVADTSSAYPTTLLVGDFDGDREDDQIYSDPYHDCGKGRFFEFTDAGSAIEWDRDTSGILGTAACGDHFGAFIVVADFDGDGYDDVAATAPGSTAGGLGQAGSISIIYGSSTGLTESGDQLLDQDSTGIEGVAEKHDFFGRALTAADYNCDGYDDVVVGVPREDLSSTVDAGAIHVIYGSATGLSTVDSEYYQGSGGVDDTAEAGDRFGTSLASGNFNGDTASGVACFDLAIGAPGEDVGTTVDAGFIYIMDGSTSGLTTSGDQGFSQDSSGVEDAAGAGDFFGMNLEVVDDGIYDGLIVQVPGEFCSSTYTAPVGMHRFYGGSAGILTTNDTTSCSDRAEEYTISTMDWGVLTHAADNYAIEVLIEEAQ